MEKTKIIVNNSVYEMGRKQADAILKIGSEQIPFGIYAVEKNNIIELRKDKCRSKKELNQLVVDFQKKGFRVYFNQETK